MIARLVEISLVQRFLLCALGFMMLFGGLYAFHLLDIVAYPDPSPPMIELITQYPGWSAEEMERQITIPIEVALNGMTGFTGRTTNATFRSSSVCGTGICRARWKRRRPSWPSRSSCRNGIVWNGPGNTIS